MATVFFLSFYKLILIRIGYFFVISQLLLKNYGELRYKVKGQWGDRRLVVAYAIATNFFRVQSEILYFSA